MGPVAWAKEVEWFWHWAEPFAELVPLDPVAQLLRLGMDGDDLSCFMDDLSIACDASVAVPEASVDESELCFGGDSEPWRLCAEAVGPECLGLGCPLLRADLWL